MTPLDPIALLVACRAHDEARALARARRDELSLAPAPSIPRARSERAVAAVLLDENRIEEAAPHVYEARRLYRPFRDRPLLSAEIDLTLAWFAIHHARSHEAEDILRETLVRTAEVPDCACVRAEHLRLAAHLCIVRGNFTDGKALVNQALDTLPPVQGASTEALLRSQLLFMLGEVAYMADEVERARALFDAALAYTRDVMAAEARYVRFAVARAVQAHKILGDDDKARRLEAEAR